MGILYRFHEWLIFARVKALFMLVWPYIRPHILCTQLVICLLSHFIHIWYLGWPWSEHAHIIPISRMVDFCKSYSPFYVCLLITLYNKPNNKFADFIADLDRLLCKLPTDALITILSGNFNVNVKKRDKQRTPYLNLFSIMDSFPLTIM